MNDERLADRAFEGILRYGAQVLALEQLGDLYLRVGRYDRAATVYERGMRLAPDNPALPCKMALLGEIRGAPREQIFAQYARALTAVVDRTPLFASNALTMPNRDDQNLPQQIQRGLVSNRTSGDEMNQLVARLMQRLEAEIFELKAADRLDSNVSAHPRLQTLMQFVQALASGGATKDLERVQKIVQDNFSSSPADEAAVFEKLVAEKMRSGDAKAANALIEERLKSGKPFNPVLRANFLLDAGKADEIRGAWQDLVKDIIAYHRPQPGGTMNGMNQVYNLLQRLNTRTSESQTWDLAMQAMDVMPSDVRGHFVYQVIISLGYNAGDRVLPLVMAWLKQPADQDDYSLQNNFRNVYYRLSATGREQLERELEALASAPDAPYHAKLCYLTLMSNQGKRVKGVVDIAQTMFKRFAGQPPHVLTAFFQQVWESTPSDERPQLLDAYFQHLSAQSQSQDGVLPAFQLVLQRFDIMNDKVMAVLERRIGQLDGEGFRRLMEMSLSHFVNDSRSGALAAMLCEHALKSDPTDPIALLVTATAALRKGENEVGLEKAVAAFKQIGVISAERQQLWRTGLTALMTTLQQRNLTKELRSRIEKLAATSKNLPEFQLSLVQLSQFEGQPGEQLTILKKAFDANPQSPVLFKAYGRALLEKRLIYAARDAAERFLEKKPNVTRQSADYVYADGELQQIVQQTYQSLGDKRGEYRAMKFITRQVGGTIGVQPLSPQMALSAGEIVEARALAIQYFFQDPIRVALAIPAMNRPEDPALFLSSINSLPPYVQAQLTFAHYKTCAEMYDRISAIDGLSRNIENAVNPKSKIQNPKSDDRFHLLALLAACRVVQGNDAEAAKALDDALSAVKISERPNAAQWFNDLCDLYLKAGNKQRARELVGRTTPDRAERLAESEVIEQRVTPSGSYVVRRMPGGGTSMTLYSGSGTVGGGGGTGWSRRGGSFESPAPSETRQPMPVNSCKWKLLDWELRADGAQAAIAAWEKFDKAQPDSFNVGVKLAWRLAGMGKIAEAEQLIQKLEAQAAGGGNQRLALDGAKAAVEVAKGNAGDYAWTQHASRLGGQFLDFALPSEGEVAVMPSFLKVAASAWVKTQPTTGQETQLLTALMKANERAAAVEIARGLTSRTPSTIRSSADADARRALLWQTVGDDEAAQKIYDQLFAERTLPVNAVPPYAELVRRRGNAQKAHEILSFAADVTDNVDVLKMFAHSCLERSDRANAEKTVMRLHWTAPRDEAMRELERRVGLRRRL
jgi:tetratricopeptide (TPR) repeat protein